MRAPAGRRLAARHARPAQPHPSRGPRSRRAARAGRAVHGARPARRHRPPLLGRARGCASPISPTYWPLAWPSPEAVTLGVVTGESSIALPLHDAATAPAPPVLCPPEEPPAYPMTDLVPGRRRAHDHPRARQRTNRAALRLGSRRHEARRGHRHRDHVRGRCGLRDRRGRAALGTRRVHERHGAAAPGRRLGRRARRRAPR